MSMPSSKPAPAFTSPSPCHLLCSSPISIPPRASSSFPPSSPPPLCLSSPYTQIPTPSSLSQPFPISSLSLPTPYTSLSLPQTPHFSSNFSLIITPSSTPPSFTSYIPTLSPSTLPLTPSSPPSSSPIPLTSHSYQSTSPSPYTLNPHFTFLPLSSIHLSTHSFTPKLNSHPTAFSYTTYLTSSCPTLKPCLSPLRLNPSPLSLICSIFLSRRARSLYRSPLFTRQASCRS